MPATRRPAEPPPDDSAELLASPAPSLAAKPAGLIPASPRKSAAAHLQSPGCALCCTVKASACASLFSVPGSIHAHLLPACRDVLDFRESNGYRENGHADGGTENTHPNGQSAAPLELLSSTTDESDALLRGSEQGDVAASAPAGELLCMRMRRCSLSRAAISRATRTHASYADRAAWHGSTHASSCRPQGSRPGTTHCR